MLKIIEKTGFKINPEKAQLCNTTVQYLGLEFSAKGRCPDAKKIELIKNLPPRKDITTLSCSLGLVVFLRNCTEDFTTKATPLYHLLKKDVPWSWINKEKEAVAYLKQSIISAPALLFPNVSKPFTLELVSIDKGISAVFSQDLGMGR